jgi:DNA-binding response OmpR family regulator
MKLLVVDDDPHLLDALQVGTQLQWEDAHVLTASDGEAGLEAFLSEEPDIVLLDVMMPRMSGFDVLKAPGTDGSNQCSHAPC